jgi:hypothetical protein
MEESIGVRRLPNLEGVVGRRRLGMLGIVGMEKIIVIIITSFMSMIRGWGALSMLTGIRILFGAIVRVVECDGCF